MHKASETSLPISVLIPTKNEERNLEHCLASLGGNFDDVVIVDSKSKDQTQRIAEKYGAAVLDFVWNGGFPKKRNWAIRNHAFRYPWVLFLDADERLTPEVIEELRGAISNTKYVGFRLSFTNWFMGKQLRHGDTFRKLALFRTDAGEYEQFPEQCWSELDMEVHEHPVLEGKIGEIKAKLEHHDYRDLKHYLAKHNEYSSWEAERYRWLKSTDSAAWQALTKRQQFKYKHLNAWWLGRLYFLVSYFAKLGILDGWAGLTLAQLKMRYFDEIRLKIQESDRASFREGEK